MLLNSPLHNLAELAATPRHWAEFQILFVVFRFSILCERYLHIAFFLATFVQAMLGMLLMDGLDQFDMRILSALSADARKTNKELEAVVKLSHSAISRRIARLEEMGVLKGYSARIDTSLLGLTVRAIVAVSREASVPTETLGATLSKIPGVVRCYVVTGEQDIFLEILARDLDAFADLMLKGVQAAKGVTTTRSIFIMRQWENGLSNAIGHALDKAAKLRRSGKKRRAA